MLVFIPVNNPLIKFKYNRRKIYRKANGNKVDFSDMPRGLKTPKLSNCKRISARKTGMIDECAVA